MRRPLVALAVAVAAVLSLSLGAAATGPGGWDHLGNGGTSALPALNGAVYALNADDPGVLFVGGAFTNAGGHATADHIARWNGTTWSALGSHPLNGNVEAIAYHAGLVYVGGQFTNAGGDPNADFLAVWDGAHWAHFCTSTVPGPAFGGSVDTLQIIGNTLYVGGAFQNGAAISSADYLLACNLTTGASSSLVNNDGDISGGVYALTADSNGVLYAAGQFINMAQIPEADHVAAYDGAWHAMGSSATPAHGAVSDYVRSITASGTNVYIGTDATNIADIPQADHVARWDGAAWHAMSANTAGTDGWFPASSFIYSLTTYGSVVIAGGSFQNANGVATADEVAYFDGTTWHPIGSNGAGNGPLTQQGSALKVFRSALCVGGSFINAGGDPLADSIASYALRRPDAGIGTHLAGPFTGNNVYSSSGAGESKTITVARGHNGTLYADIQNDGLITTSFTVKGKGAASGYSVSYFNGSTNVTSQVKAGTFNTGNLAAGAHLTLRVVVTLAPGSAAKGTFRVTATSSWAAASPDAVQAVVKAK